MFFSANIISIFLMSWLHEAVGGWVMTAYVKASTKQETLYIPQTKSKVLHRFCVGLLGGTCNSRLVHSLCRILLELSISKMSHYL